MTSCKMGIGILQDARIELVRANWKTRQTRMKAKGILILDRTAKHSLTALAQNSTDTSDRWLISSPDDVTASAVQTETSPTSCADLAQLFQPAKGNDSSSKWWPSIQSWKMHSQRLNYLVWKRFSFFLEKCKL